MLPAASHKKVDGLLQGLLLLGIFTGGEAIRHCWRPGVEKLVVFLGENQWIGLRENLQESPIFNGEIHGFLQIFP